jgi:hypothetical protein
MFSKARLAAPWVTGTHCLEMRKRNRRLRRWRWSKRVRKMVKRGLVEMRKKTSNRKDSKLRGKAAKVGVYCRTR